MPVPNSGASGCHLQNFGTTHHTILHLADLLLKCCMDTPKAFWHHQPPNVLGTGSGSLAARKGAPVQTH